MSNRPAIVAPEVPVPVTAHNAGPKDAMGLPLRYIQGPTFGPGARNLDYPRGRAGFDGGGARSWRPLACDLDVKGAVR